MSKIFKDTTLEDQDLSYDSSACARFPSLFTFPVVSNFTKSSPKNERVQKSAAMLDLNRLPINERSSSNLRNSAKLPKGRSSMREMNVFKGNSKHSMSNLIKNRSQSRVIKKLQGIDTKISSNEPLRIIITDNKQRITNEKSFVSVSKSGHNRNFNSRQASLCSSKNSENSKNMLALKKKS